MDCQTVLDFWFKEIDQQKWWVKDESFDELIRQRFEFLTDGKTAIMFPRRKLVLGAAVSIKSDKWMRRMAEEGMIELFESNQVRYGAVGTRLISYGISSYGYDVRCADEFKSFTNMQKRRVLCGSRR